MALHSRGRVVSVKQPASTRADRTWLDGYVQARQRPSLLQYGLQRRTDAAVDMIRAATSQVDFCLLDIGTADGAMLKSIQSRFPQAHFLGLDTSHRLCRVARENGLQVVQGYAQALPVSSESCDIVLLAATLKHIKNYERVLLECRRVLKPAGSLLVSDPTPLGIRLGIALGHFNPRYVYNSWSVKSISGVLQRAGFSVTCSDKYLLSPLPLPGLQMLEGMLKIAHLEHLFLHQIITAEKNRVHVPAAAASGRFVNAG